MVRLGIGKLQRDWKIGYWKAVIGYLRAFQLVRFEISNGRSFKVRLVIGKMQCDWNVGTGFFNFVCVLIGWIGY